MIEFAVNKQAPTLQLITSKERRLSFLCLLQSSITEKNKMQSCKLVKIHGPNKSLEKEHRLEAQTFDIT